MYPKLMKKINNLKKYFFFCNKRRRNKVEKKYLYKDIASKHAKKGYDIMFDSGYGGEHWLATFAVYCLTYDN